MAYSYDSANPAKRRKINPSTASSSLPCRASVRLRNKGSEYSSLARCDNSTKEHIPDGDLRNVSMSIGVLGAVPFDCIFPGEVYWINCPQADSLPWPAIVTQPPQWDKETTKGGLKCVLFSDSCNEEPSQKTMQETEVELARNEGVHSFREDPIRLEHFLDSKIRSHRSYSSCKEVLDTAITEAKYYLLKKRDMISGENPADLFQLVFRQRFVLNAPNVEMKFDNNKDEDEKDEKVEFVKKNTTVAPIMPQIPVALQEELSAMKERLQEDARYTFDKIMNFLKRNTTKVYLTNVILGVEQSTRHERFLKSFPEVHRRFNSVMHFGPWMHLTDQQKEMVLQHLRKVSNSRNASKCSHHRFTATEDYVFAVLLPEAVIKMMMSVEKLSKQLAGTEYCLRFFSCDRIPRGS